jgi:hypothetical protein
MVFRIRIYEIQGFEGRHARQVLHTSDQASPIDIAPRHSGETLTPAVLERTRYRPNSVGGSSAGAKKLAAMLISEVREPSLTETLFWEGDINVFK